ncbi:MAG: hypothetical protein CMC35_01760 [Flavobacteriaceae bacterium]|nr:hypothetical protein [Flavobacteriaceae bacterium]|tara:strand:+ start:21319 stop:23370 length:2052 start_codon:yes stop_codon:yes gene_type:complete
MGRIWIIIMLFSGFAYSQNVVEKRVDSLKSLLLQNHDESEETIHFFNELSYEYYLLNPDIGTRYADSAISLSKKLRIPTALGTSYQRMAQNLNAKDESDLALTYCDSAITVFSSANAAIALGKVYYNQAMILQKQSNYVKALDSYEKSLVIFEKAESPYQSSVLNGIGIIATYMSNYPKAIDSYQKALLYLESVGQAETVYYADILNNLGLLQTKFDENNWRKALDYFERARVIYKKLDYKSGEGDTLLNEGNIFDKNGQLTLALERYHEAKKIFSALNSERREINANVNIGIVMNTMKKYDEARDHFTSGIAYYKKINDHRNLAIAYSQLGKNFLFTENYAKAIQNFEQAVRSAKKIENLRNISRDQDLLSQVYAKLGNFEKAYKYRDSAALTYEQYQNDNENQKIIQLSEEYKYQSQRIIDKAQAEAEQQILEGKLKQESQLRIFSIIGIISVITFLLILQYQGRKKRQVEHERKIASLRLTTAQAQLNPHFIFNSLTAIDNFVVTGEATQASDYLKEFAYVMRKGLENTEKERISLQEEVDFIKAYLDIEKIRKPFQYEFVIDKEIDVQKTNIPPLLLQPILENCIRHAKPPTGTLLCISIKLAYDKDNHLVCTIEDNGNKPWKESNKQQRTSTSFGTRITRERIIALNDLAPSSKSKIAYKVSPLNGSTELIVPIQYVA